MMKVDFANFPIIDTHLHLWDTSLLSYPWLTGLPEINKTFTIENYQDETRGMDIRKMIFVQCDCLPEQSLAEVAFVTTQQVRDPRISGIVAYAPLEKGEEVSSLLADYQALSLVKGVRKMYDDDPDLCLKPDFISAVRLLPEYNLSMDLSIKPASVRQTLQLIKACPDTQFILDHLAKPNIKDKKINQYKKDIRDIAANPNVVAKISGLVTEADLNNWTFHDLQEYISYATACFGPERLMFGGDWPVVRLASTFKEWLEALLQCLEGFSDKVLQMIFHDNALKIYRI